MPQEPAYAAERRQDAEAKAVSERAKDRMSVASVRRRGMDSPLLAPQEVAPPRIRRACGFQTWGRMRSMRTTAQACGARAEGAEQGPR
jgi:hypothetical protein